MFASAAVGIGAGGLWVALSSRSTPPSTPPPMADQRPLDRAEPPLAATATAPSPTPQGPTEVELVVKADAPGAQLVFRRRRAQLPFSSTVKVNDIVELLEVSAPQRKTVRYWLTMDRPTTLSATLPRGRGLVEASELETLVALGEAGAPADLTGVTDDESTDDESTDDESTDDESTDKDATIVAGKDATIVAGTARGARKPSKATAATRTQATAKAPRAVGSAKAAAEAAALASSDGSSGADAAPAAAETASTDAPATGSATADTDTAAASAASTGASPELSVLRSSPSWMTAATADAPPSTLSDAQIQRTMERYRGRITKCRDAASAGATSITVTLSVSPNGHVSRPQVSSSSSSAKLTGCVLKSMASWKFPARKTGEVQRATYTFAVK